MWKFFSNYEFYFLRELNTLCSFRLIQFAFTWFSAIFGISVVTLKFTIYDKMYLLLYPQNCKWLDNEIKSYVIFTARNILVAVLSFSKVWVTSSGLLIVFLTMSAIEPLSMMLHWAQYLADSKQDEISLVEVFLFLFFDQDSNYLTNYTLKSS